MRVMGVDPGLTRCGLGVVEGALGKPLRMIAVGRDGVETVAHAATVYTMREGKVARTKAFQSKADALESVGMQE